MPLSSMSLSESVRDLQVALNTTVNLEKELNDKKFIDDIEKAVKIAKKLVSDAAGVALHRLTGSKPSIDAVKELVDRFPDALSCKNEEDQLLVQSAVSNTDTVKYVPIFATAGIKFNVGGRGLRGGLLVEDPKYEDNWTNTLQSITGIRDDGDPIPHDAACLDVFKELRKDNLLLRKDIREHDLLYKSCRPVTNMRFEYLAALCHSSRMRADSSRLKQAKLIILSHLLSTGQTQIQGVSLYRYSPFHDADRLTSNSISINKNAYNFPILLLNFDFKLLVACVHLHNAQEVLLNNKLKMHY